MAARSTTLEDDARGYLVGLIALEAALRFERDAPGARCHGPARGVPLGLRRRGAVRVECRGSLSLGLQGDGSVQFTRDAFGREVGRELGGAGRFEQHYDPVGRLVSQAYRGVSGDSVRREYAYDARGFLLEIQDSLRGRTELRHNDRGDLTAVLRERGWSDVAAFDGCQNRVYYAMTEHGAALREAFLASDRARAQGYDAVPVDRMMARLPHLGVAQAYERGNRVVSLDRTDGVRVELEYDANGCVVRKTRRMGLTEDTWRYAWDSRQRMTAMTAPNGVVWRYRYDATARRIEKLSPAGESWRYVWRGQDMADVLHRASADAEPVLVESYLHEPGGTCPLFRQDAMGVHYVLPDQNDSPSEEVSATGGAVGWVARRGTWAEGWRHHGHAGGEPFLGQWFDAESGLHYNRFRYYDPETGRYLSPDPIGIFGGTNEYQAISGPLTAFDRFGLSPSNCGNSDDETDPPEPPVKGRVASRINLAAGRTRFTPLRDSGSPVSAGWDHVVQGHFDRDPGANRSVFTASQDEVRAMLTSGAAVQTPVRAIGDGHFERIVQTDSPVGIQSGKAGGQPSSTVRILTDEAGNLITAYPI